MPKATPTVVTPKPRLPSGFVAVSRDRASPCPASVAQRAQPADDLQARVIGAPFELSEIAATDFSIIGEVVLGQPLLMPQALQIYGEHLAQVHARSEAICSQCAPRYTDQKE
jgi:hypothetical protein